MSKKIRKKLYMGHATSQPRTTQSKDHMPIYLKNCVITQIELLLLRLYYENHSSVLISVLAAYCDLCTKQHNQRLLYTDIFLANIMPYACKS